MIPQWLRAACAAQQMGIDPNLPFIDPLSATKELTKNYIREQRVRYNQKKPPQASPGQKPVFLSDTKSNSVSRYLKGDASAGYSQRKTS